MLTPRIFARPSLLVAHAPCCACAHPARVITHALVRLWACCRGSAGETVERERRRGWGGIGVLVLARHMCVCVYAREREFASVEAYESAHMIRCSCATNCACWC